MTTQKATFDELSQYIPKTYKGELSYKKVYLDNQGYSTSGRYFGVGLPLYTIYWDAPSECPTTSLAYDPYAEFTDWREVRAASTSSLLTELKTRWPDASYNNLDE